MSERIPRQKYEVETYASQIGDFENWIYQELHQSDLDKADRIVINTGSGNRYFIRFSKSANRWKVYNENKGGLKEAGYPFRLKESAKGIIAKRGYGMVLGLEGVGKTAEPEIQVWNTSRVDKIEVRKGVEKALDELQSDKGGNFGRALGQMFKDQVGGQSDVGDPQERAEKKFRDKFRK